MCYQDCWPNVCNLVTGHFLAEEMMNTEVAVQFVLTNLHSNTSSHLKRPY